MRARQRSGSRPTRAFRRLRPAQAHHTMDTATEQALRALARLLARQAAREAFEQRLTRVNVEKTQNTLDGGSG